MELQLCLSEVERDLLLDLLLRERRELPAEIHHTRTLTLHHELQERLKLVDAVIQRIEPKPSPVAK